MRARPRRANERHGLLVKGDEWLSIINTFPLGVLHAIQHGAQVSLQSLTDRVLVVHCGLVKDLLPPHYSYVSHSPD